MSSVPSLRTRRPPSRQVMDKVRRMRLAGHCVRNLQVDWREIWHCGRQREAHLGEEGGAAWLQHCRAPDTDARWGGRSRCCLVHSPHLPVTQIIFMLIHFTYVLKAENGYINPLKPQIHLCHFRFLRWLFNKFIKYSINSRYTACHFGSASLYNCYFWKILKVWELII